jgi:hypothetical protein
MFRTVYTLEKWIDFVYFAHSVGCKNYEWFAHGKSLQSDNLYADNSKHNSECMKMRFFQSIIN